MKADERSGSPRESLFALAALSTLVTFVIATSFLQNELDYAYAMDSGPNEKLVAAQVSNADYYAVLHASGELVFQHSKPDIVNDGITNIESEEPTSAIKSIYEGSLGGYADASLVPWHPDVLQVHSVRFADDFRGLQPLSLKCWFDGCSNLTYIDLTNLDASQSTTMEKMFRGCSSLERIDGLKNFDTSSSTYFGSMFNGCSGLKALDVSHFNATHVEVLCFMFNGCSKLETLNMSGAGWKTSSLGLMVHVWEGCSSLKSLDLSQLDTTNVRSMTYDFNGCTSLEYLDLSGADTTGVENLSHLFDGCDNLTTIKVGDRFSFDGTSDARQFSFPEGNWKSSTTGVVFAAQYVPSLAAATYVKVGGAQHDSEGQGEHNNKPNPSDNPPSKDAEKAVSEKTPAKSNAKGVALGTIATIKGNVYKVTSNKKATVTLKKAAKRKAKVIVPASVVIKGKRYAIIGISSRAFKGAKAKSIVIRTKKLKKKSVKGCFKGASQLKTVKVPKAKKHLYEIIFAKGNSGKTVRIQ